MNVFTLFKHDIQSQIFHLQQDGILTKLSCDIPITVEPPRDVVHGHVATNVAMVLSKFSQLTSIELAHTLSKKLSSIDYIDKIQIAGPGFINLHIKDEFWFSNIKTILLTGKQYGDCNYGNGQCINVEYVSIRFCY